MKTDTPEFDEAEKSVRDRIAKLLSIQGKDTVDELHKKLGHIMWENVGMARTKESLEKAIVEIQALRKEFWANVRVPGSDKEFNQELEKALRLADFLELGELMARERSAPQRVVRRSLPGSRCRLPRARPSATTRITSTWPAGSMPGTTRSPSWSRNRSCSRPCIWLSATTRTNLRRIIE